jgi:hypothetical protein
VRGAQGEAKAHQGRSTRERTTCILSSPSLSAGDEWGLAALEAEEVHLPLLSLLSSTDPALLPLVLVALIGFAAHRSDSAGVASVSCRGVQGPQAVCPSRGLPRTLYVHVTAPAALETLLRIATTYDLPFKRLAGARARSG